MRAAIYARISKDTEGTELGVTRQQEDCAREAERRGWEVVSRYVDNDVSATRKKPRPEYERMLRDIRSGHVQAVVVWSMDRLTRTPRELEDVIDLADRQGLALANVGGNTDLSTPEGRVFARNLGAFAKYETDNLSKRLKRKFEQKAADGEPHGYAPYGYERIGKANVIVPEHAAIIRECADRVLNLESLRSIVTDLNVRGVHGPKAEKWNSTILRQIMLRPTNAGLRQHRGKVIGAALNADPIIDVDTLERLTSLLTDPSRRSNHVGPGYKYLLSGVARCGLCGGIMRRQIGRTNVDKRTGQSKSQPPSYQCAECYRVRRNQVLVDEVVRRVMVDRLSMPDAAQLFPSGDLTVLKECEAQLAVIDAKLNIVADQFADDTITGDQLKRITARLRLDRTTAEKRRDAARPHNALSAVIGGEVGEKWDALPLEVRREAVQMLMTVTIDPVGSGLRFDPEMVRIEWVSEAP
jgi:DNA invertase Pin-like site-specific DNA recombinase